MSKRDEVSLLFGPKLLEAILLMTLSEINILRAKHGLAPRTLLQVFEQVTNHYSTLPDYDWQADPGPPDIGG